MQMKLSPLESCKFDSNIVLLVMGDLEKCFPETEIVAALDSYTVFAFTVVKMFFLIG